MYNQAEQSSIPEIFIAPKQPKKEIYVAVDACAELGGQPYTVLEALNNVYKLTGSRNLHFIDTEQGFHEKSNHTTPTFLKNSDRQQNRYVNFLNRNPEIVQIIPTDTCALFRNDLATKVIPKIVEPLIKASEDISKEIQKNAFFIMKKQGLQSIGDIVINKPSDIPIEIKTNEFGTYVFENNLIKQAADMVKQSWDQRMDEISYIRSDNDLQYHKGFMASMIKSTQKIKALSYYFTKEYSPENLYKIENLPNLKNKIAYENVGSLSEVLYLFSNTKIKMDEDWWKKSESIQALRMTSLWPWQLKSVLSEEACAMLRVCHKNTADISYLKLYTDHLPEISEPKNTLFVLLTNDSPLINQFLEVSTGVKIHTMRTHYDEENKKQPEKIEKFIPTNIYDELRLKKRNKEEYTHQAAWTGSEFVRFCYKEILDSIKNNIDKSDLRRLSNCIKKSDVRNSKTAYEEIRKSLYVLKDRNEIGSDIFDALNSLLEQTHGLEAIINKDIQSHGIVQKLGKYSERQDLYMKKSGELQIC